jgi:hypothetical protein
MSPEANTSVMLHYSSLEDFVVLSSSVDTLEKLLKATISFVIPVFPSVCLSVRLSDRMKQFCCSHWTDLCEHLYLSILKNLSRSQVLRKCDNNRYFTWRPVYHKGQRSLCDKHLYRINRIYINYFWKYIQFYLLLATTFYLILTVNKLIFLIISIIRSIHYNVECYQ